MSNHILANALVDTLPHQQPGLFNPWKDSCSFDHPNNGPAQKLARLAAHLNLTPRLILVGEAPGFQGCRYSGIAFTSERLLLEGAIPRIDPLENRLSTRPRPWSEPSATIVWKTLYQLGLAGETILWNALQLHPHHPGQPHSNRTPSLAEIALGKPALRLLIQSFPNAKLIAVGRKAESLLGEMAVTCSGMVRHPANGGAQLFANGLKELVC